MSNKETTNVDLMTYFMFSLVGTWDFSFIFLWFLSSFVHLFVGGTLTQRAQKKVKENVVSNGTGLSSGVNTSTRRFRRCYFWGFLWGGKIGRYPLLQGNKRRGNRNEVRTGSVPRCDTTTESNYFEVFLGSEKTVSLILLLDLSFLF